LASQKGLRFQTPRGTKDILPEESFHWQYLEGEIRRVMSLFNFQEIRTPLFEETELFARGIGQATDIVQKEMYSFRDRGGQNLTLKPEMTAPVIRAYLQHHMAQKHALQKLYYISPMFRQERPQAGRLRQFHQYGAEIIGTADPSADVEIIELAGFILGHLGVEGTVLKLNSVGCPECRAIYRGILQEELASVRDRLCSDCQVRYERNPLRILDCKNQVCRQLTAQIPSVLDHLCPACKTHFQAVREGLDSLGITYELDPRLVRGLDYYTRTAFEIISSDLGSQDAICGGGRYDLLAEELGGPPTPGVGFAAGMERLLLVMRHRDLLQTPRASLDVYTIGLGNEGRIRAREVVHHLRGQGIRCDLDLLGRSLKAQMREANRQEAPFVVILGEEELRDHQALVKDMRSGEQRRVPLKELAPYLKKQLS